MNTAPSLAYVKISTWNMRPIPRVKKPIPVSVPFDLVRIVGYAPLILDRIVVLATLV